MPGRVATFSSCSIDPSPSRARRNSSSANRRAGTRMSGRASAGTSQTTSPTRRSSDIEYRPTPPAAVGPVELQRVVGHRLDEMRRVAQTAANTRTYLAVAKLETVHALRDEALRLGEEDELLQPGGE